LILFNPLGRTAPIDEAARVVDSVFVIMNRNDVVLEDGDGRIVVFRLLRHAEAYRIKVIGPSPADENWGIYEWYQGDCEHLLFNKPHTCVPENECS
jgi:hypothetical protein